MKTLFIPARLKKAVRLDIASLKKLQSQLIPSSKIGLCSSIQFVDSLDTIKKQLNDYDVVLMQGVHSRNKGQVLGCDMPHIKEGDREVILYVGDGMFHPMGIRIKTEISIFTYNPFSKTLNTLDVDEVKKVIKRKKGALVKFLMSDAIGVLVSTKPGQNRYSRVSALKKKYKDKQFYVVAFDSVDFSSLENFPFIKVWVNTTCPRIAYEDASRVTRPIINISDLKNG
jgi:2-(3-amino-3-carboxypropyl)histidine synthase